MKYLLLDIHIRKRNSILPIFLLLHFWFGCYIVNTKVQLKRNLFLSFKSSSTKKVSQKLYISEKKSLFIGYVDYLSNCCVKKAKESEWKEKRETIFLLIRSIQCENCCVIMCAVRWERERSGISKLLLLISSECKTTKWFDNQLKTKLLNEKKKLEHIFWMRWAKETLAIELTSSEIEKVAIDLSNDSNVVLPVVLA